MKEFIASLALCNDQSGRELDFGDVKCLKDGVGVVAGLRVVRGWRCKFPIIGEGEVAAQKECECECEWGGEVGIFDGVGDGGVEKERDKEKEKEKEKEEEKECGYIRRDVTDIRRHVNLVHGVGAKGLYEACVAQSWFGGRRAVYWRVDGGGSGGGDRGLDSADGQNGDGVGCAGGDGNRDRGGDLVMSEAGDEEGQVRLEVEGSLEESRMEVLNEKNELHERKEGEGEELAKRLETPVFTSLCRWGFYGKGFGDKTPTTWRVKDGKETEIERELRLGKMC